MLPNAGGRQRFQAARSRPRRRETGTRAPLSPQWSYLSELLTEPNLLFSVVPRLLTTVMIASAIPAAIRPYSIAVAPPPWPSAFLFDDLVALGFQFPQY